MSPAVTNLLILASKQIADNEDRPTGSLIAVTKEIGLAVNADKTKYMVMSREQTAGLSHTMKVDNSSIEMWKSSNIWERR